MSHGYKNETYIIFQHILQEIPHFLHLCFATMKAMAELSSGICQATDKWQ